MGQAVPVRTALNGSIAASPAGSSEGDGIPSASAVTICELTGVATVAAGHIAPIGVAAAATPSVPALRAVDMVIATITIDRPVATCTAVGSAGRRRPTVAAGTRSIASAPAVTRDRVARGCITTPGAVAVIALPAVDVVTSASAVQAASATVAPVSVGRERAPTAAAVAAVASAAAASRGVAAFGAASRAAVAVVAGAAADCIRAIVTIQTAGAATTSSGEASLPGAAIATAVDQPGAAAVTANAGAADCRSAYTAVAVMPRPTVDEVIAPTAIESATAAVAARGVATDS